jgi:hypothetical protein
VAVSVTAGNTTTQDFTLTPSTGGITGHVTDASTHAALSGATVSIQGGSSTTTDGAGSYAFSGLTPGGYTLTASKAGYVTSGPASVTVAAGGTATQDFQLNAVPVQATGWFDATSSGAGTGGDRNGYETSRAALTGTPNGQFASDVNSGTGSGTSCTSTTRDSEVASFSVPSVGSTILGIQVQLVGRANSTKNAPKFCVEVSWDGGATFTAGKTTATLTTSAATYTLGSTSDTWGHAWTPGQMTSGSFRVRIIDLASTKTRTFYLDSVAVNVTYQ